MNIILIGFMGSGKSSVARCLSELLGRVLIEMDELVYQKTNTKNMHEVFEKGGELLLRETELAITQEVAAEKNLVISTGGGIVLNKITLDYFKAKGGKVIFLHSKFETISKRLEKGQSRPLFINAKKIYDFRLPLYLQYADEIIDADSLSINDIALKIQKMLKDYGL